jgi:predicted HicB family RNase H-like nuclease
MQAKHYHPRINLNVPPSVHKAVTARAERELTSLSDYVRKAILAQLQRDGFKFEPANLDT